MSSTTSPDEQSYGIEAQREPLMALGNALYSVIPEGFARLEFLVKGATFQSQQSTMSGVRIDGVEAPVEESFEAAIIVLNSVKALRDAMYRPGAGTWFSAKFTVTADGSMDAEYNYNDEPQWSSPVSPLTYVDDLEHFPRDPENIPEWLQAKLDEAAAQAE